MNECQDEKFRQKKCSDGEHEHAKTVLVGVGTGANGCESTPVAKLQLTFAEYNGGKKRKQQTFCQSR